jgi:hypothetical protein
VGDVVVEDGDIFGDGVNLAARLEGLAEPGGICVSALVRRDAAGKLDLAFEDMGEQQLKSIVRPLRVYRVGTQRDAEATEPARASLALPLPDKPSVAVLPLHQHERRPRTGVLRRWHRRRHHDRAVSPMVLCHRAQQQLHLQGPRH